MVGRSGKLSRAALALVFLALAGVALRYAAPRAAAAGSGELEQAQQTLAFARALANRAEGVLNDAQSRELQDIVLRLQFAVNYWSVSGDAAPAVASQAQFDCGRAMSQVYKLLDRLPQVERIWVGAGAPPRTIARRSRMGSGVELLRIGYGAATEPGPRTLCAQVDLSRASEATFDIGSSETTYAALYFNKAPEGAKHVAIHVRAGGAERAAADLALTTPPTGMLEVSILDAGTGKITPAAAAVFAPDDEIIVPDQAIAFDDGGFYYQPGRVRPHTQTHYWPGPPQRGKAFFVNGSFSVRVSEGSFQIVASKGPEYLPATATVAVKAGATARQQVTLHRWIDMPARGWYSGDGHVHYARADEQANRRLIQWTQAEDIHVASVLRMGDSKETYFEQYGFGKDGRYTAGDYALVAGQEDPRTNIIGHTLQLNIQRPVHLPDRYYFYDLVFDEVHKQGGITGYAHIVQPLGSSFFVRRDMALNIPAKRVDFAEICEFGDIGEDIYYEFLNLGFPLTASAGSDVPWGNTIGTSRVYAYTGEHFSPDAWFAALKAGHTFVTTGAMLEFTVNGQLPGSVIEAKPGDVLHIKASATGRTVEPRYLEIVAQGDVIRSARPGSLEFDLPVRDSTWIAARCSGAHTTPVYVKVNGHRFWKPAQVPTLIAHRMQALKELEDMTAQDIPTTHRGNWDNPEVWKQYAAEMRERIKVARQTYEQLR